MRVIGGEVSIGHAFEFVLRHALIGLHRKVTTETACRPGSVTDLAIHRAVVVREFYAAVVAVAGIVDPGFGPTKVRNSGFRGGLLCATGISDPGYSYKSTPDLPITSQRFCISRFWIVMRRERINRVDRLRDFPADIGRHG